ncbi:MAG TPA: hypothetical protein VII06_28485 [Chloroflexota bacterium]|jgi:quinol monooxygenase YgiN
MVITLVTQRRARARQAAALADTAKRLLSAPDAWSPARLRARLFQGRQQPELLLIVSDWSSREAAARYLQVSRIGPQLDALALGHVQYGFYHELTVYEALTAPVALATCSRITCSRRAMSGLLSYMIDVSGPLLRAQPGLVLHALYQGEDQPTSFLSMRGYDSPTALEEVAGGVGVELDAGLRERGARLTHFVGWPVADVRRPATAGDDPGEQPPDPPE